MAKRGRKLRGGKFEYAKGAMPLRPPGKQKINLINPEDLATAFQPVINQAIDRVLGNVNGGTVTFSIPPITIPPITVSIALPKRQAMKAKRKGK